MRATSTKRRQISRAPVVLIVCDPESFQAWRRQLRMLASNRRLSPVQFALPGLSDDQNRTFAALANQYRLACGCSSSGFFMSAATVATVASYFASGGNFHVIGVIEIISLAGFAFVALLLGKSWGLLWARWRLLRLASSLSDAAFGMTQERHLEEEMNHGARL